MRVIFSFIHPRLEVTAPVLAASAAYQGVRLVCSHYGLAVTPVYMVLQAQASWQTMALDARIDPHFTGKVLFDEISAEDVIAMDFTKALSDSIEAQDEGPVFSFLKGLADTITASDEELVMLLMSIRTFLDEATAEDPLSFGFTKALYDEAQSEDSLGWLFTKGLSDAVTASDVLNHIFTKGLTDTITASDPLAFSVTKGMEDTATAEDSGCLVWPTYLDPSYCGFDYVGTVIPL